MYRGVEWNCLQVVAALTYPRLRCAKVGAMLTLWLFACTPADCRALEGAEHTACLDTVCGDEHSFETEVCLAKQIPPLTEPADVRRVALRITDSVLRDTAVISWAGAHRDLSRPDAEGFCAILNSQGEKDKCVRSLTTPHLQSR